MPRYLRQLDIHEFEPSGDSVPFADRFLTKHFIGLAIGGGRTAVGAIFFAAPVSSVRLLGLDTATAERVAWLARMTAGRDVVIGIGTLISSARRQSAGGWLLAGCVADAVDAAVLSAALHAGKVRGLRARAVAAGAIVAAVAAAAATVDLLRHD